MSSKKSSRRKKAEKSLFIASCIPEFDKRRGQKPTRRDTRRILRQYPGDITFFNISFNPVYKGIRAYTTKTEDIADLLWQRYHLYKLRSTKGKPHTLNRSMYIALIKIEDSSKKHSRVLSLAKSIKKFILHRKYLNASKVHIIAAEGFLYAVERETRDPRIHQHKSGKKIRTRKIKKMIS